MNYGDGDFGWRDSKERGFLAVEKVNKKHKKSIQKSIDISGISRYYRDSFWIKKLFKGKKQKIAKNNSTLYEKGWLFFLAVIEPASFQKNKTKIGLLLSIEKHTKIKREIIVD